MTEEQNKLAEEIECNGINGRDDFSIADKEAIIAALRREPDPVLGECEECGHTIVTPLKRFREREPATEAVRDQVLEEAAKVCDEMPCDCCWHEDAQIMAETCAAAIRALKGKGASQGDERIYTKADMEAACALVLAGFRSKPMLDKMVDRFLAWPLPFSVCADLIATRQEHGRIGTNLLTATEARQMLEHVLAPDEQKG